MLNLKQQLDSIPVEGVKIQPMIIDQFSTVVDTQRRHTVPINLEPSGRSHASSRTRPVLSIQQSRQTRAASPAPSSTMLGGDYVGVQPHHKCRLLSSKIDPTLSLVDRLSCNNWDHANECCEEQEVDQGSYGIRLVPLADFPQSLMEDSPAAWQRKLVRNPAPRLTPKIGSEGY